MTLLLFWCLPAAFALGMYRAHLAARGRETGLQSYRVRGHPYHVYQLWPIIRRATHAVFASVCLPLSKLQGCCAWEASKSKQARALLHNAQGDIRRALEHIFSAIDAALSKQRCCLLQVQDLLARMQSPVPDKALQGSVMPAAALSLGSMLGDDVLQDRRTLSASVNTLHDMLGHLNPVCQQVGARCCAPWGPALPGLVHLVQGLSTGMGLMSQACTPQGLEP